MKSVLNLVILFFLVFASYSADAAPSRSKPRGGSKALKGGSMAIGLGISLAAVKQEGLNESIKLAKTMANASTNEINSGFEYSGFFTYTFSNGLVALHLRPSYLNQTSTGTGVGGNYSYEVNGYTVFPLIRFIPLSNEYIDFYLQGGIGYGHLDGKITNGANYSEFGGSNFGTQIGIGADFYIDSNHSFSVEGNYRYLNIERNIVKSSSGGLPYGVSQNIPDRELENANGMDLATSMSGIIGQAAYTFHF